MKNKNLGSVRDQELIEMAQRYIDTDLGSVIEFQLLLTQSEVNSLETRILFTSRN